MNLFKLSEMLPTKQFCPKKSHLSSHKERWLDKPPYFILEVYIERKTGKKLKRNPTYVKLFMKSEGGLFFTFAIVLLGYFSKKESFNLQNSN